jgi:hypothetical protein
VGSSALLDSTGSLSRHRECQAEVSYEYNGAGRRVRTVDGVSGVVVEDAYVGNTLVAERRGNEWVPMVYGLDLLQRGGVNQYWTWRGDLAATNGVSEPVQRAPVFDAFGDLVSGSPMSMRGTASRAIGTRRTQVGCRRWACVGGDYPIVCLRKRSQPMSSHAPPFSTAYPAIAPSTHHGARSQSNTTFLLTSK